MAQASYLWPRADGLVTIPKLSPACTPSDKCAQHKSFGALQQRCMRTEGNLDAVERTHQSGSPGPF